MDYIDSRHSNNSNANSAAHRSSASIPKKLNSANKGNANGTTLPPRPNGVYDRTQEFFRPSTTNSSQMHLRGSRGPHSMPQTPTKASLKYKNNDSDQTVMASRMSMRGRDLPSNTPMPASAGYIPRRRLASPAPARDPEPPTSFFTKLIERSASRGAEPTDNDGRTLLHKKSSCELSHTRSGNYSVPGTAVRIPQQETFFNSNQIFPQPPSTNEMQQLSSPPEPAHEWSHTAMLSSAFPASNPSTTSSMFTAVESETQLPSLDHYNPFTITKSVDARRVSGQPLSFGDAQSSYYREDIPTRDNRSSILTSKAHRSPGGRPRQPSPSRQPSSGTAGRRSNDPTQPGQQLVVRMVDQRGRSLSPVVMDTNDHRPQKYEAKKSNICPPLKLPQLRDLDYSSSDDCRRTSPHLYDAVNTMATQLTDDEGIDCGIEMSSPSKSPPAILEPTVSKGTRIDANERSRDTSIEDFVLCLERLSSACSVGKIVSKTDRKLTGQVKTALDKWKLQIQEQAIQKACDASLVHAQKQLTEANVQLHDAEQAVLKEWQCGKGVLIKRFHQIEQAKAKDGTDVIIERDETEYPWLMQDLNHTWESVELGRDQLKLSPDQQKELLQKFDEKAGLKVREVRSKGRSVIAECLTRVNWINTQRRILLASNKLRVLFAKRDDTFRLEGLFLWRQNTIEASASHQAMRILMRKHGNPRMVRHLLSLISVDHLSLFNEALLEGKKSAHTSKVELATKLLCHHIKSIRCRQLSSSLLSMMAHATRSNKIPHPQQIYEAKQEHAYRSQWQEMAATDGAREAQRVDASSQHSSPSSSPPPIQRQCCDEPVFHDSVTPAAVSDNLLHATDSVASRQSSDSYWVTARYHQTGRTLQQTGRTIDVAASSSNTTNPFQKLDSDTDDSISPMRPRITEPFVGTAQQTQTVPEPELDTAWQYQLSVTESQTHSPSISATSSYTLARREDVKGVRESNPMYENEDSSRPMMSSNVENKFPSAGRCMNGDAGKSSNISRSGSDGHIDAQVVKTEYTNKAIPQRSAVLDNDYRSQGKRFISPYGGARVDTTKPPYSLIANLNDHLHQQDHVVSNAPPLPKEDLPLILSPPDNGMQRGRTESTFDARSPLSRRPSLRRLLSRAFDHGRKSSDIRSTSYPPPVNQDAE